MFSFILPLHAQTSSLMHVLKLQFVKVKPLSKLTSNKYTVINVVCCVGRVEIQIEIQKGRCPANTDSMV